MNYTGGNFYKEDYYTEITYEEYYNFINNKCIDFNLRDINRLLQLSTKFKVNKWLSKNVIDFNNNGNWLYISECDDEWFLVHDYNKFYKCDQYDGLIYCLKDLDII